MTDYKTVLDTPKPRGKVAKALWADTRRVARSGNAITRLIHGQAHRTWTAGQDRRVLEGFQELEKTLGPYGLAPREERRNMLDALAVSLKRSPAAVKIRLKGLGVSFARPTTPPSRAQLEDLIAGSTTAPSTATEAVDSNNAALEDLINRALG